MGRHITAPDATRINEEVLERQRSEVVFFVCFLFSLINLAGVCSWEGCPGVRGGYGGTGGLGNEWDWNQ